MKTKSPASAAAFQIGSNAGSSSPFPRPRRADDDAPHVRMSGDSLQLGSAGLRSLQREHAKA